MANPRTLLRGARRNLQALAAFAIAEGWSIARTPGGHLKFSKPGRASIYTGCTASDSRAERNARAHLRRADRQAEPAPADDEDPAS